MIVSSFPTILIRWNSGQMAVCFILSLPAPLPHLPPPALQVNNTQLTTSGRMVVDDSNHNEDCMLSPSVLSDSWQPHGLWPTRLLRPWDSPGKNTGVGCHFLLQGIFPTQGSNSHLLRLLKCRRTFYCGATGEGLGLELGKSKNQEPML